MKLRLKKGNKYGARRVRIDGIDFASRKEGERYSILKLMQESGQITMLECHPVYKIIINNINCGRYTADFRYMVREFVVVEDVKGGAATKTEAYRLRKKIVEALYGITITEV